MPTSITNSINQVLSRPKPKLASSLSEFVFPSKGKTAGTVAPPTPTQPTGGLVPQPTSSKSVTQAYQPSQLDQIKNTALGIQSSLNKLQQEQSIRGLVKPKVREESTAPNFSGVLGDLVKKATDTRAIDRATGALTSFRQGTSQKIADIKSEPIPLEFQQGRAQVVQQASAEKEAALQQGVQNLITARGQDIGALQAAAGLAQPQVTSYGQTVFDPLSGTFTGGQGSLDPQNAAFMLANEVKAGRMTYEQAVASLGYAGGAGQQFLNNALQGGGGGYNIPLGQATLTGQSNVFGSLPALESADTAAEGIKNKIVGYLNSNPQLNPNTLAAGNILQQWIQGKQLTDPKYQTLFNYLNEYTNTLAPILGVGGDPTNLKTQIAQSFINAAASGQSISEVLENMQGLSRGKIQDLRSGATGGGVVSNPGVQPGGGGLYSW